MQKKFKSILLALMLAVSTIHAQAKNGFDLTGSTIPTEEILRGGPPRDGIPAIDRPVFETADEADWLEATDWVIGVALGAEARAYPLRILNWHEIVNDQFSGMNVLVTFCPLCGTGVVFSPPTGSRVDFGVSGLLYNSDVLLYDRATESLWSQILAEAVSGERTGTKLQVIPSLQTTWGKWQEEYPHSQVLSRETGHRRNYNTNPYAGYVNSPVLYFPVAHQSDRDLHPKERVLGIVIADTAKAYPFSVMQQQGKSQFEDVVGGMKLLVNYDAEAPTAWITDSAGNKLAGTDSFWFAWDTFYPESEMYVAE